VQVQILGPLRVANGAQSIEVGGARLRALLIRLAADAGNWVSVSALVEALWENEPPGDEVNALQSLVSRLRRALRTAELIESGPAGYRLAIEAEAVDGIRFERLAGQGRRQLADGDPDAASDLLEQALELWRGEPLTEVAEAGYAVVWAQRLDKLRLTAIDDRAEAGLQRGRHPELVADLEAVAGEHPLRERTQELLIRALAGSGRQTEALTVYEKLSRRLADELGLDPPAHLQRLHTAVLRGDPDVLVPAPAATAPTRVRRTNLRAPLTSFVGRDAELGRLTELIERSRLVTLVGPGGAGKTRLANEAAAGLTDRGTGGTWVVELAPVTDPEAVASTALSSIGVLEGQILDRPAAGPRDAFSRLVEILAEHDVVLILDNCEHLIDAAAKLAEYLLGECPRLTVLATSREPLGIVGESLWPVNPLGIPRPDDDLADALAAPAVQLLLDRAMLVRPGFVITADNVDAVMEICRRLDGLPLAIELAAARLRNLTVEAVAARLDDRFRLLSGGNRTAMPRHQTLRAVVSWSWGLLTDSERVLAERLSVFPGGATASTAVAVCARDAPDPVSADVVADLLMSLADKSLLVVAEPTGADNGAQPRYRMLETIREFATDQLAERGETADLRAAHARYFLALAETAEPKLRSGEQLIWRDVLTTEHDNLFATLQFAVETGDSDLALRLGAALGWYWTLLGRHDEALNWLGQALRIPGNRHSQSHAIVFVVHAISGAFAGAGMPDISDADVLLEMVTGLPLETMHPMLVLVEPGVAMIRDQGDLAKAAMDRLLAHPDPWAQAMLHLMSAIQAENDGDIPIMEERMPLALNAFREIGDRWGIGTAAATMANVYSARGELDKAIEMLTEARQLMTELKSSEDEAYALVRIGMLQFRGGDLEIARQSIEAGLEVGERTGSATSLAGGTAGLAALSHYEGRTDEARELAHRAMTIIKRAPFIPEQIQAVIHCLLATFDISDGDLEAARRQLVEAEVAVRATKDMPVAATLAIATADLMQAEGDPGRAAVLLGAAVAIRGMDDLSDPEVERVAAATGSALSTEDYDRHLAEGRALPRPEALALIEHTLAAGSGPAAVGADGQRGEHHGDPDRPEQ
jgi:predicted ATPase/DNA-binding SARP family transcriptional activator